MFNDRSSWAMCETARPKRRGGSFPSMSVLRQISGFGRKPASMPSRTTGFREPSDSGVTSILASRRHAEGDQTGCRADRNTKSHRLAYFPALLFNPASRQRRKCQSGSGIDAPRQQPLHIGYLGSSADRSKTAGARRLVQMILEEGTESRMPSIMCNATSEKP